MSSAACEIVFPEREMAELRDRVPEASELEANQIEGHTQVSLVSPGTELGALYAPAYTIGYPGYPGYAAVFRVDRIGANVTKFRPGDLAFCMGRHRSVQRVSEIEAVPVPAGLAAEHAVFARLMVVTMATLTTTTARPPAKILVSGLGVVGHLAAQIFQAAGYQVHACDPVASRRELALQASITNVTATAPLDDPQVAGHVDLVIDCSGHEAAVVDGCKIVRQRGEVVLVGVPWARKTDIMAFDILHAVFHKYAVLRSGWEWELPWQPTPFQQGSVSGNVEGALQWLADGRIRVEPLYEKVSPLKAQQVYQDLLHQRSKTLSQVFDWTQIDDANS